jgi:branched-chain amino acid transport system substrate-binding protein
MRGKRFNAVGIIIFLLFGNLFVFGSSHTSENATPIKIGHLLSQTGSLKDKGEYAAMGARLALEENNVLAGFFGKKFTLVSESFTHSELAPQMALKLIKENNVVAIVGNLNEQESRLVSELTQMQGVPFFNSASKADSLRGVDCHRYTFHLEASAAIYVSAIGHWLIHKEKLTRWYFLTDDSPANIKIYEQAQTFLNKENGEEIGHEIVSANKSNYHSILKKIKRAKPDAVFVILNSDKQINFLKQYKKRGLPFQVVGAYMDIVQLWKHEAADLTGVWPTIWYHELFRYSARELNNRFFKRFNKPMDSAAWANWAAVKIIGEVVIRSQSTEGKKIIEYLESNRPFDGHKGSALTFRNRDHQLKQPLHLVTPRTEPGKREWDILKVVTPVPIPGLKVEGNSLEKLGVPHSECKCQLEPL